MIIKIIFGVIDRLQISEYVFLVFVLHHSVEILHEMVLIIYLPEEKMLHCSIIVRWLEMSPHEDGFSFGVFVLEAKIFQLNDIPNNQNLWQIYCLAFLVYHLWRLLPLSGALVCLGVLCNDFVIKVPSFKCELNCVKVIQTHLRTHYFSCLQMGLLQIHAIHDAVMLTIFSHLLSLLLHAYSGLIYGRQLYIVINSRCIKI